MAYKLIVEDRPHEVEIVRRKPNLVVRIDGREYEISSGGDAGDGRQSIEIGGVPVDFVRARSGDSIVVRLAGRTVNVEIVDPRTAAGAEGGGQDAIRAPMPGMVVSVQKAVGDPVKRGETLITIESMKLQTAIAAARDGVVEALLKRVGETFEKDEVIVRLEPAAGGA